MTVYFTIHNAFISSEKWVNGKILPQLVVYVSGICEFDSNKDPKMTFFQEHCLQTQVSKPIICFSMQTLNV